MKSNTIILIALLLVTGIVAMAQPAGPNPNPTPFGFVELLISAGAIYGGKKVYFKNAEKSNN
jgi:proline racemase